MSDDISSHLARMNELAPAARDRVAAALKSTIEAELTKSTPGLEAAGKEFSRGLIFSRSRGRMTTGEHPEIINQLQGMDEATFSKFAARLNTLKDLKARNG